MKRLAIFVLALTLTGCTPAPTALTPAAQTAYQTTRVLKAVDLIRDTAIAANSANPPQMSTASTRKIVTWHRSAVLIIQASGTGWKPAVTTSLDQLLADLPPADAKAIAAYVTLAKTLIQDVL